MTARVTSCILNVSHIQDYAYPNANNLDEHYEYMKKNGYNFEKIICKFILTKRDEKTGKKMDVYHTWIQLK